MVKHTLLAALIFCTAACQSKKGTAQPAMPVSVTAFQVEPQTIPAPFEFVGVAKSSHPVEIRSRVEGYLWKIAYTEGSMVNEGDLLFQIDPRQFEASLLEAEGEMARQEAILWRAERSLARIEPLYTKNAVSLRDLDDATAQVLASEASVIAAEGNLINAELNLSYTSITSPIKGLTGRAAFKEGSLISPSVNGFLTEVSIIDPIWVLFSISDNELIVSQGEKSKNQLILPQDQSAYSVSLELSDGSIFPYTGEVNFKSPTLDPKTGSMVVRATFQNPEGSLLPGQFVRATVCGALRPNAIFVPQKSVFQGQKGMYVFVITKDSKAAARPVVVSEWYQDYWIIQQGLNPGELVIADGVTKVQEGTPVKIESTTKPQMDQKK